ncbi:hypothetical protein ACIRFH_21065 [Streptomyces sp. NPDC093586]|uniref:hypothetical protein n=1 Tax=Streptomyces sp. NPDC093586 TaxID=3366042 RepID=UPI0038162ACB
MRATWVGATVTAGLVLCFGWGLAGMVTSGCEAHPKGGCGVPDGGGKYLAAFLIAPWPLGILAKITGPYRRDWRPALGYSAGALAGATVTLAMGTTAGHWIVASVLVSAGALVPWIARRDTDSARETRRQERERRSREERLERARARRAQRRRDRRRRRREVNTGT